MIEPYLAQRILDSANLHPFDITLTYCTSVLIFKFIYTRSVGNVDLFLSVFIFLYRNVTVDICLVVGDFFFRHKELVHNIIIWIPCDYSAMHVVFEILA